MFPSPWRRIVHPIAHQIVERMVGTLTADPMTIEVPRPTRPRSARALQPHREIFDGRRGPAPEAGR